MYIIIHNYRCQIKCLARIKLMKSSLCQFNKTKVYTKTKVLYYSHRHARQSANLDPAVVAVQGYVEEGGVGGEPEAGAEETV